MSDVAVTPRLPTLSPDGIAAREQIATWVAEAWADNENVDTDEVGVIVARIAVDGVTNDELAAARELLDTSRAATPELEIKVAQQYSHVEGLRRRLEREPALVAEHSAAQAELTALERSLRFSYDKVGAYSRIHRGLDRHPSRAAAIE